MDLYIYFTITIVISFLIATPSILIFCCGKSNTEDEYEMLA